MKKKKTRKATSGHQIHVTVNPKVTVSHGGVSEGNEADRALSKLKYKNFKG